MHLLCEQKKVGFATLGCKVNFYESEAIWQLFKHAGYTRANDDEAADVFVINTCTVTNTGDKKSRQLIRKIIRKNPEAIICVTGCYAQIAGAEILAIPGVDIVIGTQNRDNLLTLVAEYQVKREPINDVRNIMKTKVFEELDVPILTDRTRASLKIQEGCNQFCTFCIIPWARGRMRSRKPENVIAQAQKLVDSGYKEIVLTGIHTGGYGIDLVDYSLANLLHDLEQQVPKLKRIRISSIEASQITEALLDVLQSSKIVASHLHMPIQSAANNVLKRMNRKYTVEEFSAKLTRLRAFFPDIAITSDVIVGFPGETDADFNQTVAYLRSEKFSELHVFPYSNRTGTPAAKYSDQMQERVKVARVNQLLQLSRQLGKDYATLFTNKVVEVIPESVNRISENEYLLEGYSENYLRVSFVAPRDLSGEIVRVKISKADYPLCCGLLVSVL